MDKATQKWIEIAEYDLKTAAAMLKSKRYLYVVFMCQQAIEKILKAIYTQQKNETPPRTHNLPYLTQSLNLNLPESDKDLLFTLTNLYVESRYPEEQTKLSQILSPKQSTQYLSRTKEVFKCLKEILPSNK